MNFISAIHTTAFTVLRKQNEPNAGDSNKLLFEQICEVSSQGRITPPKYLTHIFFSIRTSLPTSTLRVSSNCAKRFGRFSCATIKSPTGIRTLRPPTPPTHNRQTQRPAAPKVHRSTSTRSRNSAAAKSACGTIFSPSAVCFWPAPNCISSSTSSSFRCCRLCSA